MTHSLVMHLKLEIKKKIYFINKTYFYLCWLFFSTILKNDVDYENN